MNMLEIICEKREFQGKPDACSLNQNYMDLDVSVCISEYVSVYACVL